MPPTLTTPRLTMTPHVPEDWEFTARLFGMHAVTDAIGMPPATREQSWQRLLRYIGHWQALGFGHWLVRDRATGAALGEVGLMDSRRDSTPPSDGTAEAGWALLPEAQSQGLAREACAAMLDWADRHAIRRTICLVAPTNAASLRLAGRLGYMRWAEGTYNGQPTVMLERHAAPASAAVET